MKNFSSNFETFLKVCAQVRKTVLQTIYKMPWERFLHELYIIAAQNDGNVWPVNHNNHLTIVCLAVDQVPPKQFHKQILSLRYRIMHYEYIPVDTLGWISCFHTNIPWDVYAEKVIISVKESVIPLRYRPVSQRNSHVGPGKRLKEARRPGASITLA